MSHQILSSNSDRVTKRCLRACARCRDMKVRCSGNVPCNRCQKSGEKCYFKSEDARITVSQSYLQSLEDRVRGDQLPGLRPSSPKRTALSPPTTARSAPLSGRATSTSTRRPSPARHSSHMSKTPGSASRTDPNGERLCVPTFDQEEYEYSPNDSAHNVFISNPLVDNGETFAMDPTGKYWYMGPTSSWAFCRRVLAIIGDQMPKPKYPVSPWDMETVELDWDPIGLKAAPDVENLPSKDYAMFLAYTVKYHLGSLYDIIDHDAFHQHLHEFYDNPPEVAKEHRYWFAQFLFVLAFGEAFSKSESNEAVPGLSFASRALSLIPNLVPIDKSSLRAVEALCLAALYLQAVDLRLMAFQLIGQALRISVIEGWHRHMPPEEVGARHSRRCNTIFWTAYIIDREFGTLVGAPSSIRDEDVTTRLPSAIDDSAKATALSIQIRLSRLTATILTGVYGVDRYFNGSLITDTQSVLQSLAGVSRDLSTYLDNELRGMEVSTSKVATRLIISYHHCVVLTTRPLVMCILQRRLAKHDENTSIPEGPINSLFQACTYSAFNILKTLKTLGDRNLLDSFLPFQLEAAFSSAFLLYVIDAVAPDFVSDKSWLNMAHGIFDTMISRGSPAAQLRKREFARLEQIMIDFMQGNSLYDPTAYDHSAHQPPHVPESDKADPVDEAGPNQHQHHQHHHDPGQHPQHQHPGFSDDGTGHHDGDEQSNWDLLGNFGEFTMSPTELMNLADDLQVEDFM